MKKSFLYAALAAFVGASTTPLFAQDDEEGPSFMSYVTLWTGAVIQNPYVISVPPGATNGSLLKRGTKTDGYIELNFNYRFIQRQGGGEQVDPFTSQWWDETRRTPPEDDFAGFVLPIAHFPDFNTSIGYVFRGGDAPTNFSSSTIAGGSDIYIDASVGFPFWRYIDTSSDRRIDRMQMTLEIGGGVVTDKDVLRLHPTFFVGFGFQGAYVRNKAGLTGLWTGHVGYGRIGKPDIDLGNVVATNIPVRLDEINQPAFLAKWAPTLGFDITFPFTKALSAHFGGNVYFTRRPDAWNITVGAVLDVDRFFKALSE